MKILVILMFLVFAAVAQAATLDSEEAASKLVEQAMAKVGSGDLEGGLLLMKPYAVMPESEFNVILEQAKLQLPLLQGRFGKSLGAEFINERAVGRSLFQIVYLQKFEKHAMRWRFLFYGVNGKWSLNAINSDDKIHLWFGE
ncbi:MAG TPA: hypothetical protein VGA73_14965 [Candidatus Binatia bacterium]